MIIAAKYVIIKKKKKNKIIELTCAGDLSHQENHHHLCPGKDSEMLGKGVFLI